MGSPIPLSEFVQLGPEIFLAAAGMLRWPLPGS